MGLSVCFDVNVNLGYIGVEKFGQLLFIFIPISIIRSTAADDNKILTDYSICSLICHHTLVLEGLPMEIVLTIDVNARKHIITSITLFLVYGYMSIQSYIHTHAVSLKITGSC